VSREYLNNLGLYAKPVGDADALAQALRAILHDPVGAAQLGARLREHAGKHFSWSRTGRQLLRVYEKLWQK
jgi:glycosyltransferase involved in cell wall biosynthesis